MFIFHQKDTVYFQAGKCDTFNYSYFNQNLVNAIDQVYLTKSKIYPLTIVDQCADISMLFESKNAMRIHRV